VGKIVFASFRDGNGELYSINADGTGLSRITNTAACETDPDWSPDGTKLVFLRDVTPDCSGDNDVYVMNADGTGVTRLTDTASRVESGARWSPNGDRIVFGAGGQIYVMNAAGGGEAAVAAGARPSWQSIPKQAQTLTFDPLLDKTFGDPDFIVQATASSGLPVSFAATGSCVVTGATVHLTDGGACTITATQPGDVTYNAASGISRTFRVKKNQTITFDPLPAKTFGDADFNLQATASSGLAVSYAAAGSCVVTGSTVHLTGGGTCTITAGVAGDANFNAAPDVSRSFQIWKSQTITFRRPPDQAFGHADFNLHASASSGLPLSFASRGRCRVTGFRVHLTGIGTCTITASQGGDATYKAAPDVVRQFRITSPPKCRVPKIVGKTLAAARASLRSKRCAAGRVSKAYSKAIRRGRVISQSRRAGQVLPVRTVVNLVISNGTRHAPARRK
jgi:hypothetical protein